MTNFKTSHETYIKSPNSIQRISLNYLYTLIIFSLYLIILNLVTFEITTVINILKTILIAVLSSIIINYLIKIIIKKDQKNLDIINTISISLIISLFSYNLNILITLLAILISLIIKSISRNINLSSSIYGLLLITIYNYFILNINTPLTILKNINYIGSYSLLIKSSGSLLSYLYGTYYLSPILAIFIFLYLFSKKTIKYPLTLSYNLTYILIMLLFGLLKGMNIYYLFFQITTGNILFLSIYILTDYQNTPTIKEGQILYGIILGLLTSILRFIIPEFSVIIPLILGPILLTNLIDKLSIKLKYNEKFTSTIITIVLILIIITISLLLLLIK